MVLGNVAAMFGFSEGGFNYKSVLAVCLGILATWAFAFLGNRILKNRNIMDAYLFTMGLIAIIAVGILLWTYTKPGKKWLDNL